MIHISLENRAMVVVAALLTLATALAACGASGGSPLRDTAWELVSLAGVDLIPGTTITLTFGTAEVSGSAGCNTYGGSYEASQEGLHLSGVYATEMGCIEPKGILEQERAYLDALNAAARYRIAHDGDAGDRLEVYDGAGQQILVFVAEGRGSAQAPTVVTVL